jgi:glycosyltransferase involved in cell wall biosynthesis
VAGVHHVQDVELLVPNFEKLWKDRELRGKFQLCAAGFNLNKQDGKIWMNPYYNYVERCFTMNYKEIRDKEYKEYLLGNIPDGNEKTGDKPYRRLWGLDTFNYAKLYDLIDVSLVPLHETMFSACKSELKLIEAGFKKKACIVSNVKPYKGIATDENSILVNPNRNDIDWFVAMRKMIKEPNLIADKAEALYQTVKDKYDIRNVNVERVQLFKRLCE